MTINQFDSDSMVRIAEQVARLERMYWNLVAEFRRLDQRNRYGPGRKDLVRFTLDNALTTAEASESATITNQFGRGRNADTGTTITVHNLETNSAGVYVFEGDSGDAGWAYWGGNGNDYYILMIECP